MKIVTLTIVLMLAVPSTGCSRSTDPLFEFDGGSVFLEEWDILVVRESSSSKGIVNQIDGVDDVHPSPFATRLTYCVSHDFGEDYASMVEHMTEATREWETAALIRFEHLSEYDDDCVVIEDPVQINNLIIVPRSANVNVLFSVSSALEGTGIASASGVAPFPSDLYRSWNPIERVTFGAIGRVQHGLQINYAAASNPQTYLGATPLGVLRHELGHLLGLRHEHIHPGNPALASLDGGSPEPLGGYRTITTYDADSVMHYPNAEYGGDEFGAFIISPNDRLSVANMYGPPAGQLVAAGII